MNPMSEPFDREFENWWIKTHTHYGPGAMKTAQEAWHAAARAAREECVALIQKYIRFDNHQQHRHSWHDLQDLLDEIRELDAGPPTRTGGT